MYKILLSLTLLLTITSTAIAKPMTSTDLAITMLMCGPKMSVDQYVECYNEQTLDMQYYKLLVEDKNNFEDIFETWWHAPASQSGKLYTAYKTLMKFNKQ